MIVKFFEELAQYISQMLNQMVFFYVQECLMSFRNNIDNTQLDSAYSKITTKFRKIITFETIKTN